MLFISYLVKFITNKIGNHIVFFSSQKIVQRNNNFNPVTRSFFIKI